MQISDLLNLAQMWHKDKSMDWDGLSGKQFIQRRYIWVDSYRQIEQAISLQVDFEGSGSFREEVFGQTGYLRVGCLVRQFIFGNVVWVDNFFMGSLFG